jgi:hypothetical protein
MSINYFKWRPILERITTLTEVNEKWNICDLADAHEALDIKADAEQFYGDPKLRGK